MVCNSVELTGRLVELEPLRHTPAGVPVVHFLIAHASTQVEAGHERRVECEVMGVALGDPAARMARFRPGEEVTVHGFIARKNRMSRALVLHVTRTESSKDSEHG